MGKLGKARIRPVDIDLHNSPDTTKWEVPLLVAFYPYLLTVMQVDIPSDLNLTPTIAFVNPGSGGQKGKLIYDELSKKLQPYQIFNLKDGGPSKGYPLLSPYKGDTAHPHFLV